MLIVALAMSIILLLVANISAHSTRHRVGATAIFGVALTFLGGCLLSPFFFLILLAQTVLLCAMVPLLSGQNRRVGRYFGGSIFATLSVYCYPLWLAMQLHEKEIAFRDQVAFASLDDRLPARPEHAANPLTEDSIRFLDMVENSIEHSTRYGRAYEIEHIHKTATQIFIKTPGFGGGRMRPRRHVPEYIIGTPRPLIPQPGKPASITSGSEEPMVPQVVWDKTKLNTMHQESIVDFVNSEGFGYVKDRQHAAGFVSHGFSKIPDPISQPLQLSSIELVGLLRDKPVVYVSEHIPAMSELSKAPTRPLDSFEQQGIELLKKGQDLHIQEMPSSLRVIGAIRNAKQCVNCHGGERGDLLGAFSYVLR